MSLKQKLSEMKELMGRTKRPDKFDLPTSGRISLSQIGEEVLGTSIGRRVSLAACRAAAGFPSGRVKMSDFYGYSSGWSIGVAQHVDSATQVRFGYSDDRWDGRIYGTMDPPDFEGHKINDFSVIIQNNQTVSGELRFPSTLNQENLRITTLSGTSHTWIFNSLHNNGHYRPAPADLSNFSIWLQMHVNSTGKFKIERA